MRGNRPSISFMSRFSKNSMNREAAKTFLRGIIRAETKADPFSETLPAGSNDGCAGLPALQTAAIS